MDWEEINSYLISKAVVVAIIAITAQAVVHAGDKAGMLQGIFYQIHGDHDFFFFGGQIHIQGER